MLTCIPTKGDAGLDDTLSDHFGSAPFFVIYDSVSDTINIMKNQNTGHAHGACHPLSRLAGYCVDSIVCSAIGKRAIEGLNSGGIKVYYSDEKSVRDVIEQIKNNNLAEMDPAKICPGHSQNAGFIHESSRKKGCGCGKEHESGVHRRGTQNCCQESRFDNKDNQ